MSAEDDAAGAKREREEDPADADDAPAAKEARVDAEAPADASADPAANAEDAPAGDAPAGDAPAQEEANAPAAPAPSATLTEALDLLAPKVTKRLENLHASGSVAEGEIDAATLAELGEFSPAQAVEILDRLTEDALKGVEDKSAFLREVMQSFRAPPPPASRWRQRPRRGQRCVRPTAARLRIELADALQRLYAQGVVQPHQLDSKMRHRLRCPSTPRSRRSTTGRRGCLRHPQHERVPEEHLPAARGARRVRRRVFRRRAETGSP